MGSWFSPWRIIIFSVFYSTASGTYNGTMSTKEDTLRGEMTKNYNKEVRPDRTVNVTVTFHLIAINEVNTKDETLSSTGYFTMEWNDRRIAWNASTHNFIRELFYDENFLWRPAVIISNEVKKIDVIHNENVPMRVLSSGLVIWAPPLLMTTSCDMDISFYPFDRQTCSINIRSWSYYMDEISLQANYIDMTEYSENGEWIIENQKLKRIHEKKHGNDYSTLNFEFNLLRRPGFYVLNSVIPAILMSFLCPIVFILPADAGEKVSYSITVFLAYAVLLSMITDTLPTSSKTTSILSVFLTIITIFGALAVCVTVKILEIYHRDDNIEISAIAKKSTLVVKMLLCRRRPASPSNVVQPKNDNGVLPKKVAPQDITSKDDLTWKEVAVLWDIFLFRTTLVLSIIMGVVFLLLLVIPYYATNVSEPNSPAQQ